MDKYTICDFLNFSFEKTWILAMEENTGQFPPFSLDFRAYPNNTVNAEGHDYF